MDDFSDDGFDDLPDNALQELENTAFQFTQIHRLANSQVAPPPPPSHDLALDDYDFDDDVGDLPPAVNKAPARTNQTVAPVSRPAAPAAERSVPPQSRPGPPQSSLRPVSARIPPLPAYHGRRPPPRGPHHVLPSQRPPTQSFGPGRLPPQSQFVRPSVPHASRHPLSSQGHGPAQATQAPPVPIYLTQYQDGGQENNLSALQAEIKLLKDQLTAARGEAAILRSNSTRAAEAHENEVAQLKKINAEQLAKQERIAEAALLAQKSAATELQFLQHDMKEVTNRARRKEVLQDRGGTGSVSTTPKKGARTRMVPDGFDEMDIVSSPSKNKLRSALQAGERTPSKGKRKRPVLDSPVLPLETHTPDAVHEEEEEEVKTVLPVPTDGPYPPSSEFLHLILDHASERGQPSTFDILSRYSLPSDPKTSLSTMIFQALPRMGNQQGHIRLLVDFSTFIIDIWGRCMLENCLQPVREMINLLCFVLQLHSSAIAPYIVDSLLPAANSVLNSIAEPRTLMADPNIISPDLRDLEENLAPTSTLSLVYFVALACTSCSEPVEESDILPRIAFWRLMSMTAITRMLAPQQPFDYIIGMLDLLCTSVSDDSIGPIVEGTDASEIARTILDEVSLVLVFNPQHATAQSQKQLLRLASLRTLTRFATSTFGTLQMIEHAYVIPRMVVALCAAVNELYDQDPGEVVETPLSTSPPPTTKIGPYSLPSSLPLATALSSLTLSPQTKPQILQSLISLSTFLLHALITGPDTPADFDIQTKLSTAVGCAQNYLLTLSRLNFAEEDLVFESGIDSETVERAHELLELYVVPEVGRDIWEVYGGKDGV